MEKVIMGCSQCAEVIWKFECTEKEVADLKRQRCEDAKANEKVASIYATQEQTWFGERNRLRQQIAALLNQLGIFEKRRAEYVESLTGKIKDLEELLASKMRLLEEVENRSKELGEELKKLEKSAAARAEEHAAEILKNKTAFVQLVSAHRQLEAELGRAFRQVEVSKDDLSLILEQKDDAVSMVQKLSLEVVKLRNVAEQKDETGSQKHTITSMWYKHRNPRIKLWQTQAKISEREIVDERKYRSDLEQRHHLELKSLAEQLRLRDEKIEILHWRCLSTEIKSEQLRAHLEVLKKDNTQLIQVNLRREEQLINNEAELHYLKDCLASGSSSKESVTERKSADSDNVMKTDSVIQLDNDTEQDGVWMDVEEVPMEQRVNKKTSNCSWKMDVHAFGVSFKVKRLKQQLIMLERFAVQLKSVEGKNVKKAFPVLIHLLNKQVCRYESLQSRMDELCHRMNKGTDQHGVHSHPRPRRKTREEIKALEMYLHEALQLQRYMVASGQKLTEIQSGISAAFSKDEEENSSSIEMFRFACSMQDTLKEIQKGLEIQFSRIIGDLESTLACDGMESYT